MAPDQDEGSNDDAGVLSPEELDITDDENVVEIDEGRYVISAGGGPPSASPADVDAVGSGAGSQSEPAEGTTGDSARGSEATSEPATSDPEGQPEFTAASVHEWLRSDVRDARSQYGFDVTAKFEDSVSQQELFSNDVSTTFENLIVWYAQHVGGDTPVEEVLGILLMESNVSPRYPQETVRALASEHGLSPDDSIADLIERLEQRDRVSFPP